MLKELWHRLGQSGYTAFQEKEAERNVVVREQIIVEGKIKDVISETYYTDYWDDEHGCVYRQSHERWKIIFQDGTTITWNYATPPQIPYGGPQAYQYIESYNKDGEVTNRSFRLKPKKEEK